MNHLVSEAICYTSEVKILLNLTIFFLVLFSFFIISHLIHDYRLKHDPAYHKKIKEKNKLEEDARNSRREEEKKSEQDKIIREHEMRLQIAYNYWMFTVYDQPTISFQINNNEFNNGPYNGPWSSPLFNEDVKEHIESQKTPLYLRSNLDIEEERYKYSPRGRSESQLIMDMYFNQGKKVAESALKELEKERKQRRMNNWLSSRK